MTVGGQGGDWEDPLDDIDFEEFQLDEPGSYDEPPDYQADYEAPPVALISCPSCGAAQSAANRHCEQCGARLGQGAVPVAPRPLAPVSAGTRALTVILAVLAGVVLLALIFTNLRGGGDETAATTESTETTETTAVVGNAGPIQPIEPIDIECSTSLNDTTLACGNLIDGTAAYWNDLSLRGEGAVITVTFAEPVQLEQVQFVNIDNDVSFRRN